jgi:osmotically-inducible protein OsmY
MKGKIMAKQNSVRTALILSVGLLLCGVTVKPGVGLAQTPSQTASQSSAQKPCGSTTDAEIVAAIHEKIKADKRFDDQWKHINVSSRNRVVTLQGWVKGRIQAKDLIKYARTTRCVRRVISRRLSPFRAVGCAPGMKRCGDICIDRNQDCNLIQ